MSENREEFPAERREKLAAHLSQQPYHGLPEQDRLAGTQQMLQDLDDLARQGHASCRWALEQLFNIAVREDADVAQGTA